ncbi:hypothetical protein ACFSCX_21220 [Bacillus salitolerans]|uniref:Uncharacterized protein n=1 Tax=Bacillus salitolerans TaxID=1437434 RepID=A0ABW4LXW6_9BACI
MCPIYEMTKNLNMSIPESPNYFRGVTLSINVDEPNQVDEILLTGKKQGQRLYRKLRILITVLEVEHL